MEIVVAGLGVGIALAGAPGPVQAVLLVETVRGGMARGFRAMAGANATFGVLLVGLALGLSVIPPGGAAIRILKVAGGAYLLWLAEDGLQSQIVVDPTSPERQTLPPAARGSLAVLLNPGIWLFLGTAVSSLFAAATLQGGRQTAVITALALLIGLVMGDGAVVLIGGFGVRRASEGIAQWIQRGLAVVLGALGIWLVVTGIIG